MTQHEIKQNTKEHKSALSDAVLERIEKERVQPCSKLRFACIHAGVWLGWGLSVVFGAMSVAVLIYVGDHARFALYEATHETPVSFFIEVLPYMWIVTFLAMAAFGYYNMRHTKSGYRYPMWHLLASSVVFSLLGGFVMHVFGAGYIIDTQIGKRMPTTYTSLEQSEYQMWQMPSEGRLVGVFTTMDEDDSELYVFTDEGGDRWKVEAVELRGPDRELLVSGGRVRVLGTTTDTEKRLFHACGVFPWMYDKNVTANDMKKDRKLFIEKMHEHMEEGSQLEVLEEVVFGTDQGAPFRRGLCRELTVMKRLSF